MSGWAEPADEGRVLQDPHDDYIDGIQPAAASRRAELVEKALSMRPSAAVRGGPLLESRQAGKNQMFDTVQKRKTPEKAFALFTIIILLLMMFPLYALGNSALPIVIGLPFSLFWVVFWIGVEFVGLVAFIRYEYGR
jgi:hypothetical protein